MLGTLPILSALWGHDTSSRNVRSAGCNAVSDSLLHNKSTESRVPAHMPFPCVLGPEQVWARRLVPIQAHLLHFPFTPLACTNFLPETKGLVEGFAGHGHCAEALRWLTVVLVLRRELSRAAQEAREASQEQIIARKGWLWGPGAMPPQGSFTAHQRQTGVLVGRCVIRPAGWDSCYDPQTVAQQQGGRCHAASRQATVPASAGPQVVAVCPWVSWRRARQRPMLLVLATGRRWLLRVPSCRLSPLSLRVYLFDAPARSVRNSQR